MANEELEGQTLQLSHLEDEHDTLLQGSLFADDIRSSDPSLDGQWPEVTLFASSSKLAAGAGIFKRSRGTRRVVRNLLIFGFRGTENFLVYLWIFKDLAWTQTWYYTAFTFGFLSILAQLILVLRSIYDWNFEDIWHQLAQTLW